MMYDGFGGGCVAVGVGVVGAGLGHSGGFMDATTTTTN